MNTFYIITLFFSITLVLWLLGFAPHGVDLLGGKYGAVDITDGSPQFLANFLKDWGTWFMFLGAVSVGALLGGLNLIALVPFAIAYFLFDLFTFPTTIFSEVGFPVEISVPLTIFFTLLKVMVFLSFIRSGN